MRPEVIDAKARLRKAVHDKTVIKATDIDLLIKGIEEMARDRYFPIIHLGVVPWRIGVNAFKNFRASGHGGPPSAVATPERVAQRGGFTSKEMDHWYPQWRKYLRPYTISVTDE